MDDADFPRLDRSHFEVVSMSESDDSVRYWLSRPVEERLQAIEMLRRTFYGYSGTGPRLQRVLEIAQLDRS